LLYATRFEVSQSYGIFDKDGKENRTTNLSKLGVDRFLLQRIVNHTDSGVTAVYDRYSHLEEKRDALQKWVDKLDDIVR
jgi:hypothetical protein